MAFIGASGGLFGGGQPTFQPQIVGISANVLALNYSAQQTRAGLLSLSLSERDQINAEARLGAEPAVLTPWEQATEARTLNSRIRDVRDLTTFIDTDDAFLEAAAGDVDKEATFVLYRALDNLRTLAEYAADATTSEASLARIDEQFQKGFAEVKDYLATAELDKLGLFLGEKEYNTETTVRLGDDETDFSGAVVTDDADAAIDGITGTEVFTVSITKGGETTDIDVDLSGVSGTLSLNNIVDHINNQIQAELLYDSEGALVLDDEGNPVSKFSTTFEVSYTSGSGYTIDFTSNILEEVSFSAQSAEPTLYVASTFAPIDGTFQDQGRVTEINDLEGTLTVDDTIIFSSTDLAATDIKARTKDVEEDDLDPGIATLRDQFLADAVADTSSDTSTSDDEDDDDNSQSITNIDSDVRVGAPTQANRIATDSEGAIYVVGTSQGSFDHQVNVASDKDVYVTKFDSEGNVVFSRLLGAADSADVFGVTVDSEDNLIITGQTNSALSSSDIIDGSDAFITKLTKRGDEVFTYQLDGFGESAGVSVAVDSNNDIYIGGYAKSAISATSGFGGGRDSLVLKLDGTDGSLSSSAVIGASTDEEIRGIGIASDGNIIIAAEEDGDAVVRKLDATDLSNELGSINLGSLGSGSIEGVTIDGSDIYVAGITTVNGLAGDGGASTAGGQDGFISKVSESGSVLSSGFTTYIGTSTTDTIADVSVNNGKVYVAGSTAGTLTGETSDGVNDGYVARIDASSGALEDQEQFGVSGSNLAVGGVAFTDKGNSVLNTLGLATGPATSFETRDITTQTSVRDGDHFYISIDGGRKIKIEIEDGDDFDDIARTINIAAVGSVEVSSSRTSEGDKLKISTTDDGPSISLIAGAEGQDALEKLGLKVGTLLSKNEVFDLDDEDDEYTEDDLGGVFGLGLEGALNVADKTTAKYVLGLLDGAISTVQRAFRSLEFDPIKAAIRNGQFQSAPPPPRIAAQIANYQDALFRLQSSNLAGPSSLFT